MVLLKKQKHTHHYVKRYKNNSERQQAERAQNHCVMPQVNSPRQTYVHQCWIFKILPQSWLSPLPYPVPTPPKKNNKGEKKKHLPSLQKSETVQRCLRKGIKCGLWSQATMCFLKTMQGEENWNIDQRTVTSCAGSMPLLGLSFHMSVCLLGVVLSFRGLSLPGFHG